MSLPSSIALADGAPELVAANDAVPDAVAAPAIVRLEGVRKVFAGPAGPVTALDNVDICVGRGEIFGIIGRSGAGKSTLLRLINRLETPSAGRVIIDGEDITRWDAGRLVALRQRIGMIFQHFNLLWSKTVFDNVALPLRLAGRPTADILRIVPPLLELVGLADKRDVYPAKLSGGQKQRVGIARALASNPDILLCDEATSALDPETTAQILDLLQDIRKRLNLTIILITHEMAVIRDICDRVAVLDGGRVVEQGAVWNIFAQPQAEATRRLVGTVSSALPPFIAERVRATPQPGDLVLLRLRYAGTGAYAPVLSEATRALDTQLSVIHGSIDYIQQRPLGDITVAARADTPAALDSLLNFLRPRVFDLEVIGYVPRFG